jgi:exosortase
MQNRRLGVVVAVWMLATVTAWAFWPTLAQLARDWQGDDDYSVGQLVPLVGAFLVWRERKSLRQCPLRPCWFGGVALLLMAQAGWIYGLLFMFESAQRYALVLALAGLVLMVAGWRMLHHVSWIALFLCLMVPLPGRVHNLISGPLQRMATTGAVFLLEAFGARVSQQGNVVVFKEGTSLAVAEACSGLRMLMAFIIVAAFIAYMVKRASWQKVVLLVSSVPIAIIGNIVRIFATAVLMLHVSEELAETFFHDLAGFAMMLVAVLLTFCELWLMDRLVVSNCESRQEQTIVRARSAVRA